MAILGLKFFVILLALVFANFAYQAFAGGNYALAIERSWFRAVAVICCWLGAMR